MPFPSSKSMVSLICRVKSFKRASNKTTRLPIKHNVAVVGAINTSLVKGKKAYFTQKYRRFSKYLERGNLP